MPSTTLYARPVSGFKCNYNRKGIKDVDDVRVSAAAKALARIFDCDLDSTSRVERRVFKGYAKAALKAADAVDPMRNMQTLKVEEVPRIKTGDFVTIINPKENSYLRGQIGRVFKMEDLGRMADVDFLIGGLFSIPSKDLGVVEGATEQRC